MSKTETPDIVTMLQTAINDRGKGSVWGYAGLLEDATAEIERLRTELAKQSQWPVLHRRHKGASMTHPIPDAAIEAGARFLCAEMSDDFREGAAYWKHVAQGFITALAAEGLVVTRLGGRTASICAGRSVRLDRRE